jgi:hypothetical protein
MIPANKFGKLIVDRAHLDSNRSVVDPSYWARTDATLRRIQDEYRVAEDLYNDSDFERRRNTLQNFHSTGYRSHAQMIKTLEKLGFDVLVKANQDPHVHVGDKSGAKMDIELIDKLNGQRAANTNSYPLIEDENAPLFTVLSLAIASALWSISKRMDS